MLATAAWLLLALQVGDPTVESDHPQYPGEGALQTIEQCVERATAGSKGAQEKAISLYKWMLTHQFHLMSPQEWNVPGRVPGANLSDYEMVVYDANKSRFSYGYGLCGTVHAWNEPYWRVLGMRARRRAFPGHTNSEIEYDGAWHAFDTDMAGLVFRRDGVVAGYDDIAKDPSLVDVKKSPIPQYPFAWPSDFNTMKKGWQEVSKNAGKWYALYNGGYAAQPGIVTLRKGEAFTRYFDRDHFGGPGKRRFWYKNDKGPFRNWTFMNRGEPHHDGAKHNAVGNASYGNAEFVWKPSRPLDVYAHFSPYVICGSPKDGGDPMTGKAAGGLVVTGKASGETSMEISVDGGDRWTSLPPLEGTFTADLTDHVKGRYGWRIRFGKGKTPKDLEFRTVGQMSHAIYPRLKPGGTRVTYRGAGRSVVRVLPDFSRSEAEATVHENKSLRSANINFIGRKKSNDPAFRTTNNKPAQVVFRIEAPEPLLEVHAAARFRVRSPSPKGSDFHLEVSTDEGKSWAPMGAADLPPDNEFSSGWTYGSADMSKARVKSALVRVHLYAGGYQTGLIAFEGYGVHSFPSSGPVTLTYGWKEGGKAKTHVEKIKAGARSRTFTVPTGKDIVDDFIRLESP